jgi:hypothetical protein
MAFYVVKNQTSGAYLSMRGDAWVTDLRDAAIFTLKSSATNSIRRAWQADCCVERIERLPDRVRRTPPSSTRRPTDVLT